MAELDKEKKETTQPSPKEQNANAAADQVVKCRVCGHILKSTELMCPTCGTLLWKNIPGYIQTNQKIQLILGGFTASIAILVGIGVWGLMRNRVTPINPVSINTNPMISADTSENAAAEKQASIVTVEFGAENYTMPDVRGLPAEEACQALECMGLRIIVNPVRKAGVGDGCVAEQSIAPYRAVNRGDTVYLSVSEGAETKSGTVPDFTGVSYEKAVEIAADNSMALVVTEKIFDSIESETQVMAQAVAAGGEIGDNQVIGVTVALYEHQFKMPDLSEMEEPSARQIMQNLGADVSVDYEENLDMTNGMVFFQSIEKDGVIVPNTDIRLKVTQNNEIVIPEVVGMTQNEAVAMLRGKGLTVEIEYDHSNAQKKDYVISQSIPGNSIVTVGSGNKKIILVISDPDGSEVLVEVPDVTGKDVEDARQLLQNRGFLVKVVKEESSKTVNVVIRQSLTAGEKQAYGSQVVLTISKGKSSPKPETASSTPPAPTPTPAPTPSTSSSTVSKPDLSGIPPADSTDPRDKAIRTLMLSGITREQIDSGAYDDIIAIYMQGYGG